ncbi:MAG: hypothetical protein P3A58_08795 [Gemmatimonadota bacterium]|nr:hypothetical protein [Gemmatimonadota bacterium]
MSNTTVAALLLVVVAGAASCGSVTPPSADPAKDREQVMALERDVALSRYTLREEFSDGTAFVGRFASLARRHEGRWLLYRTSFSTIFRGPAKDAPSLAP